MSFSVATTILSTLLIIIRILMSSKIGNTSARKRYSKPMEIIVESSALYSVAYLVHIPFIVSSSDISFIVSNYTSTIAQTMTVSFHNNNFCTPKIFPSALLRL